MKIGEVNLNFVCFITHTKIYFIFFEVILTLNLKTLNIWAQNTCAFSGTKEWPSASKYIMDYWANIKPFANNDFERIHPIPGTPVIVF